MNKQGWYVNQDGVICSTDNIPDYLCYKVVEHSEYISILIYQKTDNMVVDEFVLWESLEDLKKALIN